MNLHATHSPKTTDIIEALLATLAAALLYFGLQGELPYHDAQRFADQTASGHFVWDIAHILLQPSAMLLEQIFHSGPIATLKTLSSLFTAAAIGLFYLLLLRLNLPRWQVVLGTLLLAGCASVLTLAPSAHPKLMAFPFVNGALLVLCLAESRGWFSARSLIAGGVLLALGGAFLASVLATVPFAAVAILYSAHRSGSSWPDALKKSLLMAVASGITFLLIVCIGYIVFTGEPLTIAGLTGSVAGKADLRPPSIPLVVYVARAVFGTINNLVAVPGLGATVQAWMRGQISSLQPYAGLLPILLLWVGTGLLVAAVYLRALAALVRGKCMFVPVAFLIGAQAWTIWYGLNDPEHWFQLTAPTIILFLTTMPAAVVRFGLPAWATVAAVANFSLLAIPVATYPVTRHSAELAAKLGPNDRLVAFGHYPGRPYVGFLDLRKLKVISVDLRLEEPGAVTDAVLAKIDGELTQTLSGGGHVLVADILDPLDWEAPWMSLLGRGVSKQRLQKALLEGRTAVRLDDVGGIKLWELRSATAAAVPR